jgi:beta-N-acetylhexosaminidase
MRRLGEMWMQAAPRSAPAATAALQAGKAATACGFVLGAELRACGVDLSFTPVLDLDHGESGVIGDRAFHRDPQIVTVLAQHLMHGLLQSGMANCGKHFPGHGFVRADSHTEVPVDKRSLKTILADDALPYAWLSASLQAVMPAHVIYPKVDDKPAGFSARWLQKILRERLGFNGVIFSDDLSMEAATAGGDVTTRALAALNAGCDMVLLCNQPAMQDELLANLTWSISAQSIARLARMHGQKHPPSLDALHENAEFVQAVHQVGQVGLQEGELFN